jgi:hypothetical protein
LFEIQIVRIHKSAILRVFIVALSQPDTLREGRNGVEFPQGGSGGILWQIVMGLDG